MAASKKHDNLLKNNTNQCVWPVVAVRGKNNQTVSWVVCMSPKVGKTRVGKKHLPVLLAVTSRKNKTTINLCGLLPPQARQNYGGLWGKKQPVWPVVAARGKKNQPVGWVVGCCKCGRNNLPASRQKIVTCALQPQAGGKQSTWTACHPLQARQTMAACQGKIINLYGLLWLQGKRNSWVVGLREWEKTIFQQGGKELPVLCGRKQEIRKKINLCSLSLPKARQNHSGLSEGKTIQPVWPVAAAREKQSASESGGGFSVSNKKNLPPSGQKNIYLCSQPQAEKTNQQSTCLRKPGKWTINLHSLFRGKKQKTINLCGTSKTSKACEHVFSSSLLRLQAEKTKQ